jgi:hypothetical protein
MRDFTLFQRQDCPQQLGFEPAKFMQQGALQIEPEKFWGVKG